MADIVIMKSRLIRVIILKANCGYNDGKSTLCGYKCTVDMNFIVVCERIMELQPGKKMNLMMMMMNES